MLVDDRLRREFGDGLVNTVRRLRGQGIAWAQIAERLSKWTGIPISRQLLQQWAESWSDGETAA